MSMQQEKPACAACGGPIEQLVGEEFCSVPCFRAGRAFCKFCDEPLSEPKKGFKSFCDKACYQRYYRRGAIDRSYLEEWYRSTCKACNRPIDQPKHGGKKFCSRDCRNRYHRTKPRGLDIMQSWGGYAPQTRKILRELEIMGQIGTAKRMAAAIADEYVLRSNVPTLKNLLEDFFTTHICKSCNREFRVKKGSKHGRTYCRQCSAVGRRYSPAKLTWEQVDEIRNLHKTSTLTCRQIAEKFGVERSAISSIIRGLAWKPEHDPRRKSE